MEEMQLLGKVDLKQEWTHKSFHGILHTFFPAAEEAFKPLRDYYGDSFTSHVFFVSEDHANWYWNTTDMKRMRDSLIAKVNEDPSFLDKLQEDWLVRVKAFEEAMAEVGSTDLSKLDNEELFSLYKKLYLAYLDEFALCTGLQESFSMHADELVLPAIKKFLEEKGIGDYFVEYYSILTAPVDESFIFQERFDLLRILEMVQKSPELTDLFGKDAAEIEEELEKHKKLKAMLEAHAEKFYWVQNNYAVAKVLDMRFFINEVKRLLLPENAVDASGELKKMEAQVPEIKERKKKLIEELGIPQELQNLLRIGEVFTYMQDVKKKYTLISNHYQKLFRDEIGKRLGLSEEEMDYTYIWELEGMLMDGKVDKGALRSRKKNCMGIFTLGGYQIICGDEAGRIYDRQFRIKAKADEIRGAVASKGIARGIVRVVRKTHDLVKVMKGDVLVASMTRPEMVTAMEKACAIVTDEGGLTCHAAIVSRELGIPCIIGTKIATTVLKDGDEVEVNADKGKVKKISG